jgi:2-oxoisovalerate dehydrogenase E1 component
LCRNNIAFKKRIKVAYPSNAEMKGLMKAAFYDGNPAIMLEHKGFIE